MSEGITQGNAKGVFVVKASLTPAQVNTVTAPEQTFTVPGVKLGDAVFVSPPAHQAGVAPVATRVTAANTVGIAFANPTGGNVTPPAGEYLFTVVRPSGPGAKTNVAD